MAATKINEYKAQLARRHKLTIVRGCTALDGAEPVAKTLDGARRFEARAAYDAANLYVRFDVTAPNELVNAESDPKLLFKGGNCLDIQLAADQGDVRVLVTRQAGRPFAVIYRPKVKDFKGERIVLKSPTGQEPFDAIEVLDTGALDDTKTAEGFRATATLPLGALGWKPQPGQTVKMDLGYLFGNAPGTQNAARAYWMNNSFTANVVNNTPHESRLEPKEWGAAAGE